jgi:2'-5' RNA ligase
MRLFVAVIPPPETQALAAGVIDALRRPGDGVSWVKRDNLHYTLRFIGETGGSGAKRVEEAAREAAASVPRFGVALGRPGAFPDPRRARVLWLGLQRGHEPFAHLALSLERSLSSRGFAPEGREFSAHLTLGRVREPGRDWTADLEKAAAPEGAAASFEVAAIEVVESRLAPGGSIYTVRARAELAAST